MLKTDSLQAYWRFEKPENFLDFDGSNDYVNITNNADYHFGSGDFTIGAWVYLDETTGTPIRAILGCGGGVANWGTSGYEYNIFSYSNGKLYFQCNQGASLSVISTSAVNLSYGWHYVTISRISSTITMYLDGVSIGSGSISGAIIEITGGTPHLAIGNMATSNYYWNGLIRNVRLYKGTGLTQTQIQDVMQSERLAPTANLVGYWQIDEGTGTNVVDDSGNSNDGTISGASWTTRIQDVSNEWYPAELSGTSSVTTGGKFGSTYYNTGGTGYATVPGGITLVNDLTISCWVKTAVSTKRTIFSYGTDTASCFELEVSGVCGFYSVGVGVIIPGVYTAYTSINAIYLNVYSHIVYTRSGTGNTHKIYVNGVQQSLTTATTDAYVSTTNASLIGGRKTSTQMWHGYIDELMLFNKALGLTDVKRLMMGLHPLVN